MKYTALVLMLAVTSCQYVYVVCDDDACPETVTITQDRGGNSPTVSPQLPLLGL